jgi:hypothetical protein
MSPLTISYKVTEEDLVRGVGWRLAIYDTDGSGDAQGTIHFIVPFDSALDAAFQQEKISLRSGEIWPSVELQTGFSSSLEASTAEGLHGIISLNRPLICEEHWHFRRQGIIQQNFLPRRHAFGFIRKGANIEHKVIAEPLWAITPLEPEDKVNPHILLGDYARFVVTPPGESAQSYVVNADETLELSVLFARGTDQKRITAILNAQAIAFSAVSDSLWHGTFTPEKVVVLASYDEVEWIEAGPEPFLPLNDITRSTLNVDAVQNTVINLAAGTIAYNGLSGNGITVGVDDNGIDATHNDLSVVLDIASDRPHGTHVAGIIGASGGQSDQINTAGAPNGGTPFQWRGMAPRANLVDSHDLISTGNLLDAIQNQSLDITNHSHTVGVDGVYNSRNQTLDQEIHGRAVSNGIKLPRRPHVCASANNGAGAQYGNVSGYFSNLNQTKNTVLVGNWNAHTNALRRSSSMGPNYDGRLKPDVVAPGTWIKSTGTASNEIQTIGFNGGVPTMGSFLLGSGHSGHSI